MAHTKEEMIEINKQQKLLLLLLLKKTGTSRKNLIDMAEQQFIMSNLDVLTPAEKRKFNKLILS